MKVERFEDLDAWKVGRELANLMYAYGREGALSKDYGFNDFNVAGRPF
jgi:hypothetical protein